MYLISPKYILSPDELYIDKSIVFDNKIIKIGKEKDLLKEYKKLEKIKIPKHSCLTPGFVNAHVHLEYSSNKHSLKYGNFTSWLESVILNREDLANSANIDKACFRMLKNGITSFGAISSFAKDLKTCVNTPQKVIYFNELIGSKEDMIEENYKNFLLRFEESMKYKSSNFIPALSIHSPYSTHPILIKRLVDLAKKEDLLLSTHFLESKAERDWLSNSKGDFLSFFKGFLKQEKAINNIKDFISYFDNTKSIFVHCLYANEEELKAINDRFIVTCPISNRLLTNTKLNLNNINNLAIGTDGLSSNYTLDIIEELKVSLFNNFNDDIHILAKKLLRASTKNGAKALALNTGEIKEGRDSDFIIFDLCEKFNNLQDLRLNIIIQNYKKEVFVEGSKKF